MSQPSIRVSGLWKEYVVGRASHDTTLYDMLSRRLQRMLSRTADAADADAEARTFWALRDVNIDVQPGEVLGVIGRNGAGKSTLLKILSRITAPTRGSITVRGRLASLLEVGTGFHPELSGRENIFLNGAILGMTRSEVARKFDQIVAFAEVDRFVDTPVKRYSSGMYVRLAFAVAAHLDADVLLVDEVLAVGDMEFQRKCLGTMKDSLKQGRTVVFVSHNMGAIEELCTRCILLERGGVRLLGAPQAVTAAYFSSQPSASDFSLSGPLARSITVNAVLINGKPIGGLAYVDPAVDIELRIHGTSAETFNDLRFALTLSCQGTLIGTLHDIPDFAPLGSGPFELAFRIPAFFLRPGDFVVGFGCDRGRVGGWAYEGNLFVIRIAESWDDKVRESTRGAVNFPQDGNARIAHQSSVTSLSVPTERTHP